MTGQEVTQFSNAKPGFFYGYIIAVAAFFIMLIIAGTYYSFGVFVKPVSTEFGWTRAMISGGITLASLMMGFFSIVTGRLCDKFGPRIVATACGLFLGLGFLLMSQINAIWQLYLLYGIMVAIGVAGCWAPMLSTVARWFVKRRGLMTGIVASGMGFGTIIIPPVAIRLISSYDWRTSYLIIGIITLAVILPTAQFLKRDPHQMGLLPYGENEIKQNSSASEGKGFSLKEAIHTKQFWMACAIYFCYGFFLLSIIVHIAPHAIELEITPINAANIVAIIGGLSIVGRVAIGNASDRFGIKPSLAFVFILVAVVLLGLQLAKELWMLYLFAVIFGFGYGGVIALQSPLVAKLFGLTSHGAILGIVICSGTGAGAIGSFLAGHIFDITSSYYLAFFICAIITAIGFILVLLLRPIRG